MEAQPQDFLTKFSHDFFEDLPKEVQNCKNPFVERGGRVEDSDQDIANEIIVEVSFIQALWFTGKFAGSTSTRKC